AEASAEVGTPLLDTALLRQAAEATQDEERLLREKLAESEKRLATARRNQAKLEATQDELRTLASIALRHLGGHCPVCAQTYDETTTRRRLEELARNHPRNDAAEPTFQEVESLALSVEE